MKTQMILFCLFITSAPAMAAPVPAFMEFRFMGARIPLRGARELLLEAQDILGRSLTEAEVVTDLAAILETTGEQLLRVFIYPREEGLSHKTWISTPAGLIRLGELKVGSFVHSYNIKNRTLAENQIINYSSVSDQTVVYGYEATKNFIVAREGQSFYAAIPSLPLPKFVTPALPRDFTSIPGAVVARILDLQDPSLIGEKLGATRRFQMHSRFIRIRLAHELFNFIANGYLIPGDCGRL